MDQGHYRNATLLEQTAHLSHGWEQQFVNCEFPNLVSLIIEQPASMMFLKCCFRKLRSVRLDRSVGGVFDRCRFYRLTELASAVGSEFLATPNVEFIYDEWNDY